MISSARNSSHSSEQADVNIRASWPLNDSFAQHGSMAIMSSVNKRKRSHFDSFGESDGAAINLVKTDSYTSHRIPKRTFDDIDASRISDERHDSQFDSAFADDSGSENHFSAHDKNKISVENESDLLTRLRYKHLWPESMNNSEVTKNSLDTLEYWESQKIKAEYEKLKMETELIKQRMEQESVLFRLKKRAMEAKIQHFICLSEATRAGK